MNRILTNYRQTNTNKSKTKIHCVSVAKKKSILKNEERSQKSDCILKEVRNLLASRKKPGIFLLPRKPKQKGVFDHYSQKKRQVKSLAMLFMSRSHPSRKKKTLI